MASVSRGILYKYKGRTRNVETRSKDKRLDSKRQREELLTSRRKGILTEADEEESKNDKGNKVSIRQINRREELMKWKKQRDEKKKKETLERKPIFKLGGTFDIVPTTPLVSTDDLPPPNKVVVVQKPTKMTTRSQAQPKPKSVPKTKEKVSKKKHSAKSDPPKSPVLCHMTKKDTTSTQSHDKHVPSEKENVLSPTNQSAWIPGAVVSNFKGSVTDFDNIFSKQCFSPFQFTGKNTALHRAEFTFRKELTLNKPKLPEIISDSLEEEEEVSLPPPAKCEQDYVEQLPCNTGLSDDSIEAINITVAHNNDYTNQQVLQEDLRMAKLTLTSPPVNQQVPSNGASPFSHKERNFSSPKLENDIQRKKTSAATDSSTLRESNNVPSSKDYFKPYYQLHSNVTDRFTKLCQEWDEKLRNFEETEVGPTGEVIDDIRTTVCQAQLLMRHKLKQYLDLVISAEEGPTAEHRTTVEDLQGFWDMVFYQVVSIDKKFDTLRDMECNNWLDPAGTTTVGTTTVATKDQKPRRSKRRASTVASKKLVTSKDSSPSERLKASRAMRDAARLKLKEMRLAARVREDEEPLASSPKTMKQDDSQSPDVQSGDLIAFSPPPPPPSSPPSSQEFKTPRSRKSSSMKKHQPNVTTLSKVEVDTMQGAFMTKLVQINASKKMIEKFETDVIMSPARRSKRLADQERKEIIVDSLRDIPTDFAYHPNKSMFTCN